jgi:hypothetical protein
MTILEVFNKVKDLYKKYNLYNDYSYINNCTDPKTGKGSPSIYNPVTNIFYDIHFCILTFECHNKFRVEQIECIIADCSNFYSKYGDVDTNIKSISMFQDKIFFTCYE